MITYRTNSHSRSAEAGAVPEGKVREAPALLAGGAHPPAPPPLASPPPISTPGDIIYGAMAIARYLFGEQDSKARRRVFNLWAYYRDRQERAGFFKLKGALCLSKKQWRDFHGLG